MLIDGKEWKLVPRWKLERAAAILERDGDEYGVGADLRAMIATAPMPPEATEAVQISAYDLLDGILVQRVQQMDKSYLWAVRQMGNCLSITGEWHYEPTPSSRDDKWLALHRFPTAQTAIDAAIAAGGEE